MSEFDQHESDVARSIGRLPFDDSPDVGHREALRRQVLAEFDRSNTTRHVAGSWQQTFNSWRQFMRRPIPRLIATSIVCLSIIAPWLFFPNHQTKAFAFSNLASAIVEAKTAKFKIETTMEGVPKQTAQAYYLAPGKMRMEMSILGAGVAISDDETLKTVTLMPLLKTAMVTTAIGRSKDKPSENPFVQFRKLLSDNRDAKDNRFKPIGQQEIDGAKASGFRSETGLGTFTIWGDLTTGKLLKAEISFSGSRKNEVVLSEIEINVDLDEKLFDMTPPADYKVQKMEIDVSPTTEQTLIDGLRFCGEMSGGEFPDSIGLVEPMMFFFKHAKEKIKALKEANGSSGDWAQMFGKELLPIQRGFTFATELPDSADAHYAGKGAKQGMADRPIFWYRPKDSKKYRVIYADLSVKETDDAPIIEGAVRLIKAKKD